MKNLFEYRDDYIVIHGKARGKSYEIFVDREDIELILENAEAILIRAEEKNAYATYREKKTKKYKLLHRLIMNTPEHLVVDHINHNGLDNRKVNLRNCTTQENGQNQRLYYKKNTIHGDKYRGVQWVYSTGKFKAHATVNGVKHNIGTYDTPEQAHQAALEFRKKHMPFATN